MDAIVNNFFYDIIARLIPGLVILLLYGNQWLATIHDTLKNSSIFPAVCIFLVAWLIGLSLDILTLCFGVFVLKTLPAFVNKKLPKTFLEHLKKTLPISLWGVRFLREWSLPKRPTAVREGKEKESEAAKFARIQLFMSEAETVLFRVMFCICTTTFFWWPPVLSDVGLTRFIYSLVGFAVSLVCWIRFKNSLRLIPAI